MKFSNINLTTYNTLNLVDDFSRFRLVGVIVENCRQRFPSDRFHLFPVRVQETSDSDLQQEERQQENRILKNKLKKIIIVKKCLICANFFTTIKIIIRILVTSNFHAYYRIFFLLVFTVGILLRTKSSVFF